MRRSPTFLAALLLTTSLGLVPATAASVHFKPPSGQPTFLDQGLALQAKGALSGLGNVDLVVDLTATANVTATCTNPAGANQPPGRNPAPITVAGSVAIPASEIKNGNVAFTVTTTAPPSTIAGAPGCPNPNWTERIEDLAFTTALIEVEQPPGTTVLTISCVFNPATINGNVPTSSVSCSTSR